MRPNTSPPLPRPVRSVLILIAILTLAFAAASCQDRNAGKLETIRLGLPRLEQNALIYIAEQQGFFAQNSLKIVVKDYDSGVTAVDALLKGEVDLAEAAEFPFVGAVLRQEQINIITTNGGRRLSRSATRAGQSDRTKTTWL